VETYLSAQSMLFEAVLELSKLMDLSSGSTTVFVTSLPIPLLCSCHGFYLWALICHLHLHWTCSLSP